MNLHVPQSIDAEVELMVISRCALHIVSPQRNGPINGPVQDALVASLMLTMTWRDNSFTTIDSDIVQNIYRDAQIPDTRVKDLMHRAKKYYPEYIIEDIQPVKDTSTYREKENSLTEEESFLEFSPVFENLKFAPKIPGSLFLSVLFLPNFCYERTIDPPIVASKPKVIIEDGVILPSSGPLEARTVGGKNGSVVHDLWKCSPELSLYFISDLQQLTDRWLPTHGFTIGPRDCLASSGDEVAKVLLETRAKVDAILRSVTDPDRLEIDISAELNSAMAVGPTLAKNSMVGDDKNALNVMRNAGAKGSVINLCQIVAFVGQQNIRGQRMPRHLSHGTRCLPCFLPGDNSMDARGFISNNYLKGLTPPQAFFHAAAGRDGVISTSMRTADSGYTQKTCDTRQTELESYPFF